MLAMDCVGGAEPIKEWLDRGPIYSFDVVKDSEDRSTEVQLDIAFAPQSFAGIPPPSGNDSANFLGAKVFLVAE